MKIFMQPFVGSRIKLSFEDGPSHTEFWLEGVHDDYFVVSSKGGTDAFPYHAIVRINVTPNKALRVYLRGRCKTTVTVEKASPFNRKAEAAAQALGWTEQVEAER